MSYYRTKCERARELSLVLTLSRLGLSPVRESEREAWYLSPLRLETKASFKVSKSLNRWYDHGAGIGGNVIDLVTFVRSCSVSEALIWLEQGSTEAFVQPQNPPKPYPVQSNRGGLQILYAKALGHPALVQYLIQRHIPLELARDFVREVHFVLKGKRCFALGLQNRGKGWELRSKYHKLCASPKETAHLLYGHKRLCVVEGMFDLLSLLVLDPKWSRKSDFLVLNSLALIKRSKELLAKYKRLELALDNDTAGDSATEQLMVDFPLARDRRKLYAPHKDPNEKLMRHGPG